MFQSARHDFRIHLSSNPSLYNWHSYKRAQNYRESLRILLCFKMPWLWGYLKNSRILWGPLHRYNFLFFFTLLFLQNHRKRSVIFYMTILQDPQNGCSSSVSSAVLVRVSRTTCRLVHHTKTHLLAEGINIVAYYNWWWDIVPLSFCVWIEWIEFVDYGASERYKISMTIAKYDYWLADSGSWNGDEAVS